MLLLHILHISHFQYNFILCTIREIAILNVAESNNFCHTKLSSKTFVAGLTCYADQMTILWTGIQCDSDLAQGSQLHM